MIIDVLLPLNLSKCFSYKVPNGLTIKIGDFVEVPFLNKKYIGVVWNNKVKLNEKTDCIYITDFYFNNKSF